MRSQSVTALRRKARSELRASVHASLIGVALTAIAAGVFWLIGGNDAALLGVVLSVPLVALVCGIAFSEYAALRRLQRLAMTALPVTPMVMRLRHHDTVSTGGSYAATSYPITEYWADLWHPQGVESQPSPRAPGSSAPIEEPVAPVRPQPDLRVRLREPTDAELPLEVDVPVEVLGTPEHRQWVLILTATRILWPLQRAHTPRLRRRREKMARAAAALGVALATVVTVTKGPEDLRRHQDRTLTTDQRSQVRGVLAGSVDRYSNLLARGDRILGSIPYPDATARKRQLADQSSAARRWRDFRGQASLDVDTGPSTSDRAERFFVGGEPDPLRAWDTAMNQALTDLRTWEETATSWQIGEVPRSTRDVAEAKVKRDLAKAMSYALDTARSDDPTAYARCPHGFCSTWDFIVLLCASVVFCVLGTIVIAIGGDALFALLQVALGLWCLVLMVVFGAVIYHWVGLVPMAVLAVVVLGLAVVVLGVWLFLSRLSR